MSDLRSDRLNQLLMGMLIVSAVGLVLPTLGSYPLVLDEHASYWLCEPDNPLPIIDRNLAYAATPPMSGWTQRAALTVFGTHEWSLRLPSVLGYLVAAIGMFFSCRGMLGTTGALLASLALVWHPDVVDEVRIGRPYGLVLAEMVALLALTLHIIRLLTSSREEVPVMPGVLWGLVAGAAAWTHVLTMPSIAMTGLSLLVVDLAMSRSVRRITLTAGVISLGCGLSLWPMLMRMWAWKEVLNYQTGEVSFLSSMGTFVWVALPLAVVVRLIIRRRSDEDCGPMSRTERAVLLVLLMGGVVPVLAVAFEASGLPSLNNPRYRLPLAAAQACLFGLLLDRQRRFVAVIVLLVGIAGSWFLAGRSPFILSRLSAPQAVAWKDIGETLAAIVKDESLDSADIYVQSGIIEATLVPEFYDDPSFHGYVSSRLGRFYAPTPNPRLALPLFWPAEYRSMIAFFSKRLDAVPDGGCVFVVVATDTDVNRDSFADFRQLLERYGYEITPITDHSPWAVFYRCCRKLH